MGFNQKDTIATGPKQNEIRGGVRLPGLQDREINKNSLLSHCCGRDVLCPSRPPFAIGIIKREAFRVEGRDHCFQGGREALGVWWLAGWLMERNKHV